MEQPVIEYGYYFWLLVSSVTITFIISYMLGALWMYYHLNGGKDANEQREKRKKKKKREA